MFSITNLFSALVRALNPTHRKLCASNGTKIIDDDAAYTGLSGVEFIALTDTVIAVCSGISPNLTNGVVTPVDFMSATYNWVTIPAGTLVIAPDGYQITAITLTSGSIALY